MPPDDSLEYRSYLDLIRHVDDLLADLERHPDPVTRERVVVLLQGLDALHREGLERLAARLREGGDGEALDEASRDPIVRTLLGLYGLAELDLPEEERSAGFVPLEDIEGIAASDGQDR